MDKKLIIKLSCLVGYLLFAGFSAYYTATSLCLNLLKDDDRWTLCLVFVLVLVVSILAGYCLTNVISELKNHVNPSRSSFVLNLLGFLIFWGFSFTTNVHYLFVTKGGMSILTRELASAKTYIVDNTSKTNSKVEEQKQRKKDAIKSEIKNYSSQFERELQSTIREGFGDRCIDILKCAERALRADTADLGDKNKYIIYDEINDAGDKNKKGANQLPDLNTKYQTKMYNELSNKLEVINNYYDRKKNTNEQLTNLLDTIKVLEEQHLPAVEKDGSARALYLYQMHQDKSVIAQMPKQYEEKCVVKKDNQILKYNTYPSNRMFDSMSVWGDIISGRLPDMSIIQWVVLSLILDLVAFILFALFRN
ncbi:MAG: hypothetical protein ACI30R_00220 [Sodaliphilus sp.]